MNTCRICGIGFTPKIRGVRARRQAFCSRTCMGLGRQETENPAWRGGYVRPDGYRFICGELEHRRVMEKVLGRRLRPGETVHHLDGVKLHNVPSNLEVLPGQAAHVRRHAPFRNATHKECVRCHQIKPRTEFFRRRAARRDTHLPECKACFTIGDRQRRPWRYSRR